MTPLDPTELDWLHDLVRRGRVDGAVARRALASLADPAPAALVLALLREGALRREDVPARFAWLIDAPPVGGPASDVDDLLLDSAPLAPQHPTVVLGAERLAEGIEAALRRPDRRIGRYVVVDELGRGGMGVVFRAFDPGLQRQVALKLLNMPAGDARQRVARLHRFQREGRLLARLRHPGLVTVHEVGLDGGRPYLVMDLVEGASLHDMLRERPLPSTRVLEIMRDVAAALGEAHANGLVHRDVKPSNILVRHDGRAVLADFGLARELQDDRSSISQAGYLVGTPAFLSPEQAVGAEAVVQSDVFALGATLYFALTRALPFQQTELPALLTAIQRAEFAAPRVHEPGLDPAVEALVLGCMRARPEERPADGQAVADAIGALLAGQSPAATTSTASPRRSAIVALPVVAAALVVAALVAALVPAPPPSPVTGGPGVSPVATAPSSSAVRSDLVEAARRLMAVHQHQEAAALLAAQLVHEDTGELRTMLATALDESVTVTHVDEVHTNAAPGPGGLKLLLGDATGRVRVADLTTGTEGVVGALDEPVSALLWAGSGLRAVGGARGGLAVTARDGAWTRLSAPRERVVRLLATRDGPLVVHERTAVQWRGDLSGEAWRLDLPPGEVARDACVIGGKPCVLAASGNSFELSPGRARLLLTRSVSGLAEGPRGATFVATGSRVSDARDGQTILEAAAEVVGLTSAISPSGAVFLVLDEGDRGLEAWSAVPGEPWRRRARLLSGGVRPGTTRLSLDGRALATVSADGAAWVWDLMLGRPRFSIRAPAGVRAGCYVDAAHLALLLEDDRLMIVPLTRGLDRSSFVAAQADAILPWRAAGGFATWRGREVEASTLGSAEPWGRWSLPADVTAIVPLDDVSLAAGLADGSVHVLTRGGGAHPLARGPSSISGLARTERQLAVACADEVRVVDLERPDLTTTLRPGAAGVVAIGDERLVWCRGGELWSWTIGEAAPQRLAAVQDDLRALVLAGDLVVALGDRLHAHSLASGWTCEVPGEPGPAPGRWLAVDPSGEWVMVGSPRDRTAVEGASLENLGLAGAPVDVRTRVEGRTRLRAEGARLAPILQTGR